MVLALPPIILRSQGGPGGSVGAQRRKLHGNWGPGRRAAAGQHGGQGAGGALVWSCLSGAFWHQAHALQEVYLGAGGHACTEA